MSIWFDKNLCPHFDSIFEIEREEREVNLLPVFTYCSYERHIQNPAKHIKKEPNVENGLKLLINFIKSSILDF